MPQSIVAEKVDQAVAILRELDIDCWLTFVRETTETGDPVLPLILGQPVTWQSAFIITSSGERIAIVGKYEDKAVQSSGDGRAWTKVLPYVQSIRSPLTTTLQRLNPRTIAVNYSIDDVKADGLSHGMMLLLREYLKDTPFVDRLVSAEKIIRSLRSRKTSGEVSRIKSAITTTDEIFTAMQHFAKPGHSEAEISRFMHDHAEQRGVGLAWEPTMCPIVTTGPDSMVGHGLPSESLTIAPGNIFHVDFGIRKDDYCSDIQRCWYPPKPGVSKPPDEVLRAFDTVVRAIQAAAAALKPGVECWTVDAAARQMVIDAGYPEYQHATGHTVGRAAHDGGGVLGPKWERYGKTPFYPVEAGNVFTLELGVDNVDGRGYLGLEEMVLVTERGVEWLTIPQTELAMLGV
jgi:Xaa-Pro aminopeptidase